ncbi:MAG: haloacid dehalogenase type II [Thermoplasmata archaeon]
MRALAFDVFGTLFDVEALRVRLGERSKGGEELLALWRRKQLEYTFLVALMRRFLPFSEVTKRALSTASSWLEVGLSPEEVEDLTGAWSRLPLYPDVAGALENLKESYTLVVLSNGETALLHALLEGSGISRLFSLVLSAEQVETYKPSPRVYELAVSQLNLPPGEIGMVSSNAFDIMGAKAAGLKGLWINRAGGEMEPLDLEPDLEARDFTEFVDLLGASGMRSEGRTSPK